MLNCCYCGRSAINLMSNSQHETYCKSNPNRKIRKPSYGMLGKTGKKSINQYIKGTAKPISDETRKKLSESATRSNLERWKDPANREKQSVSMKRAVANNPQSYSSSNRGRVKEITYNGLKFQGAWELDFYKWCERNDIVCHRNIKGFQYTWNGNRTYFPDFYLPKFDVYVEVKGYKTDRDDAKWRDFTHKLKIIFKEDIYKIRKNCYNLQCEDNSIG